MGYTHRNSRLKKQEREKGREKEGAEKRKHKSPAVRLSGLFLGGPSPRPDDLVMIFFFYRLGKFGGP